MESKAFIEGSCISDIHTLRVDDTGWARGSMAPRPPASRFCVAKRKKRNKGKKQRVLQQKLLKDCHQS